MRSTRRTIDGGKAALVGSALMALAGCTPPQPVGDPEVKDISTVEYACKDGTKLAIWFEPESAIVTENDGETLFLPQKLAGSGIWYGNNTFDFRGKGDSATWTSGSRPPTSCTVTGLPPA